MKQTPISAFDTTSGMLYFARMLDKIHIHARGELREDFIENLGGALDSRCSDFLRVSYAEITKRTLEGGTPEEILAWCFDQGRALDENDILIWNHFVSKLGWNDHVSELLEQRKAESHLSEREEIKTMIEYFEYDEGRKS
jgi:gluconokinase